MQEAAVRYQEEGFSQIYVACTGTNTQKLIDLLETMFGDQDEPDLEGLESETMKEMREEETAAKKADIAATEGPIPSGSVTRMVVTSLPVPLEFGLQPEMCPKTESVKEPSKKDPSKRVTKFYYACHRCPHSSQNKPSMYTHARRCFNIKLVCPRCQEEYESSEGIDRHIAEIHDGECDVQVISKTKKDDGVTPMVTK